ncbi:EamA family transporter [Curtobacterium sp. MCJR17_043]|uniref:EamA family transporter n=1 Tax=Curtobacterium sp. MCJR17_043 TaxID=2175660 RepID=UPI0024DFC78B|nr:EamA family transporter [Curtobacterium sp. MCJR17_043]WIB36306.1 EamA family transporter [Curtobacterium sp. MCJR17_043]
MLFRDRILALVVAVAWGLNFPATAIALEHFPPFLLAAVRFTLLAVPTLLFVPRPQVPFRWILLVGSTLGVVQFAFLYLGMSAGMPSGLASLVIQAAAPFTVVLAGVLLRERLTTRQVVGVSIAVAALGVIAVHRAQTAALLPVVLVLLGGDRVGDGQRGDAPDGTGEPAAPDALVGGRPADPDGRAVVRGRGPGTDRAGTGHRVHARGAAGRPRRPVHRRRGEPGGLRHLVAVDGEVPVEHGRAVLDARARRGGCSRPGRPSARCPMRSRPWPGRSWSRRCCGPRARRGPAWPSGRRRVLGTPRGPAASRGRRGVLRRRGASRPDSGSGPGSGPAAPVSPGAGVAPR